MSLEPLLDDDLFPPASEVDVGLPTTVPDAVEGTGEFCALEEDCGSGDGADGELLPGDLL
jgi:hypothetical protein